MKVILINGSPHSKGSTFTALNELSNTLNNEGIETNIIQVGDKVIRGCLACNQCRNTGKCVIDDEVNKVAKLLEEADGLVVGSPVYYASANGTLISFLDRLFYSTKIDLTMKVGASIVSCRRSGASATFDQLNKYFTISGMPIVSSEYWNNIHGNNASQAIEDLEGLRTMRILGKNMAFLIKGISNRDLPDKEAKVHTNFIR